MKCAAGHDHAVAWEFDVNRPRYRIPGRTEVIADRNPMPWFDLFGWRRLTLTSLDTAARWCGDLSDWMLDDNAWPGRTQARMHRLAERLS